MKPFRVFCIPILFFLTSMALSQGAEISGVPNQCGMFTISGTLALIEGIPCLKIHTGTQSETILKLELGDSPAARQAGLLLPTLIDQNVEISGRVTSLIKNQRGNVALETLQRAHPAKPEGFRVVQVQRCLR